MEIKEFLRIQREFDRSHATEFNWSSPQLPLDVNALAFLVIALCGEAGELANIVKKVARGTAKLVDQTGNIRSECADVLIYLLKLSDHLSIDLEEAFLDKLEQNRMDFKKYEVPSAESSTVEDFTERPADIVSRLRDLKYRPDPDISSNIDALVRWYADDENVEARIGALLEENAVACPYHGVRLFFAVFLSFVLADIAMTLAPDIQDELKHKAERLCQQMNVAYAVVKRMTAHESQLIALFEAAS
jgi:NTP pyrophosphatase (non-canonical NTP hydrolase)